METELKQFYSKALFQVEERIFRTSTGKGMQRRDLEGFKSEVKGQQTDKQNQQTQGPSFVL